MTRRTLAVVSAGLSQPSSSRLLADQLAAAVRRERPGVDVVTIELRDIAHDITNNLLTGFPPAGLREALDTVARADGLIAVTPIFNASYSGLFKSFFDVVEEGSLADKPVLIAATGGTARHSLALEHALRPMFSYLHAVVVPTAVFAAPEDWGGATVQGALASRITRATGELAREISRREPVTVIDPFDEPTPFEELLAS
ncbi:FMN reductase [Phytohabitans aurantiacus]|uniref:FMN reductase n=1 Tax=Phytohabitans aurantiacus TaxID=3016789 RepID=A0ABQ5QV85_9ACTN|nr:FMN reductase [Phytohabitans aurantiacus]GLH97566.1 FMN reductase [Phytohabitans aurantiacus]